jgi:hypothetical protein
MRIEAVSMHGLVTMRLEERMCDLADFAIVAYRNTLSLLLIAHCFASPCISLPRQHCPKVLPN